MDWVFFLQIEMFILTVGFVILMTITHWQTVKDNSKQESWNRIFKGIAQAANIFADKAKNTQDLEKTLDTLLKKYAADKTEKKEQ